MSLTPAAEITRAETGQRARSLRVRDYEVTLDLTRGAGTFGSVSLVRFDCAEPGAASHADLLARAAHEITLNGVPLDPAAVCAGGRITLPALAAHNELRVVADCAYTGSGTGLHRSAGQEDGGTHIYGSAGCVTWHFEPTPRLPTFTTTVVAGDYHVVTASTATCSCRSSARGQRGRGLRPGLRAVLVPVPGHRGDGRAARHGGPARDGAHVVRRPGDPAVVG
jgi:hypothetical protein